MAMVGKRICCLLEHTVDVDFHPHLLHKARLSPRYQQPHAHCPHDHYGLHDHHLPHDHYLHHDHHRPHDHHHLKRAPTVTMVSEMELGWGRRG